MLFLTFVVPCVLMAAAPLVRAFTGTPSPDVRAVLCAIAVGSWLYLLIANPPLDAGAMAAVLMASAVATWTLRESPLAWGLALPAGPAACLAAVMFAPPPRRSCWRS